MDVIKGEEGKRVASGGVDVIKGEEGKRVASGGGHFRATSDELGLPVPRGSDCACESDGGDSDSQGTPQGGGG
eukprot:scaffold66260_cov42-Phaeocystis_antarctica.AAC.1